MKTIILFLILLIGIITSSCFSYMFVFYREESFASYHKDSLIKVNNYYVDSNNNLSIYFKANLHGKKREKDYHVKIPLNKTYKDTMFYNEISINEGKSKYQKYKGYTKIKIKRRSVKTNLDTLFKHKTDTLNQKLTSYNISAENYSKELYSIHNDDEVIFQYLPDDKDYFYYIRLNQKKKWDKRYLLPLTLSLDIVTFPIQLIFIIPEWIKGMNENKRREKENSKIKN